MKKLSVLIVALGMIFTLSTAAAWTQDPPPPPPQSQQQPAAQEETVRGKVTNFSATSLTIEVEAPAGPEGQPAQPKSMDFVTDSTTKTEGTLENGVTVTVTYKKVDGQNIATRINVEKKK